MLAGVRESCQMPLVQGQVEGLRDGRTAAALEKGRPQAKSRGLGAEDLEPSRAWKDQAQRIQWLKEWILRFGLWREGRAQEQELLLEGSGPARVRGPHGALVRGVLGLKSGGGGWVVVLRKENCRVRGEASGPGQEGWFRGPRGPHPRSQCSQRPRRAQFRVRTTRHWGTGGVRIPASEVGSVCVLRTVSGLRLRTAGSGRCGWVCPRWPGAPAWLRPVCPQLTEGKMMERRKKIALELSELVVYCRPVPFDEESKGPAGVGGWGCWPGGTWVGRL